MNGCVFGDRWNVRIQRRIFGTKAHSPASLSQSEEKTVKNLKKTHSLNPVVLFLFYL